MPRAATIFALTIAISGCGTRSEGTIAQDPEVVTCKAAQILIHAPESLPTLGLDFRLGEAAFRKHVAELLAYDTCQNRKVAIRLPEQVVLENGVGISIVRARLGFNCDWQSTYHTDRVQILINSAGQILCEGNLISVGKARECYRGVFQAAIADDFPFVAVELDWAGEHGSLIGGILADLVREHWAIAEDLAFREQGLPICELKDETLQKLAGPFEVNLLRRPTAPPPLAVQIDAPTICVWKYAQQSDSLK